MRFRFNPPQEAIMTTSIAEKKLGNLKLDDFRLDQAIFQARFAPSFWIWDRASAIWYDLVKKHPLLKVTHAQPVKLLFNLEKAYDFGVEPESFSLAGQSPKKAMEEYIEILSGFTDIVVRRLEVTAFTRIGMRFVYFKKFATQQEASQQLLNTGLIKLPEGERFGVAPVTRHPEYAIRVEGASNAYTARIRTESRVADIEPTGIAITMGMKPIHMEEHGITYDLDYYVHATTLVGQFRALDWVRQATRVVILNSDDFLAGG
jgi:hypothetical protein